MLVSVFGAAVYTKFVPSTCLRSLFTPTLPHTNDFTHPYFYLLAAKRTASYSDESETIRTHDLVCGISIASEVS